MFSEDDLLPLSGLQHMEFCERRWALVQIENIWEDNRFTAEGNVLHEKAHSSQVESRPGVLIRRTVPLHSFVLGLSGQADIVEFYPVGAAESGVIVKGKKGRWRPYPVEYKRSRDKKGSFAYRVQLCAQAICLEEMLGIGVLEGAVFDGEAKRRQTIEFDAGLREQVAMTAARMHHLFQSRLTPPPIVKKACESCSLVEPCFPSAIADAGPVEHYYRRQLAEV
jgi:CRISPR-associated exonuclease Cas4